MNIRRQTYNPHTMLSLVAPLLARQSLAHQSSFSCENVGNNIHPREIIWLTSIDHTFFNTLSGFFFTNYKSVWSRTNRVLYPVVLQQFFIFCLCILLSQLHQPRLALRGPYIVDCEFERLSPLYSSLDTDQSCWYQRRIHCK